MKRLPILLILICCIIIDTRVEANAQYVSKYIISDVVNHNFMKQFNDICTKNDKNGTSYYSRARKSNEWISIDLVLNNIWSYHFIDTLSTAKLFVVYAVPNPSSNNPYYVNYKNKIYFFNQDAVDDRFIKPTNKKLEIQHDKSIWGGVCYYDPLFTIIYEDGKLSEPEYDPEKIYFLTE